jgi:hypothetical protein
MVFSILCQDGYKMRYVNRDYVCDGSDHSSWKCKPTFQLRDGVKYKIGEAPKLPTGTFKK